LTDIEVTSAFLESMPRRWVLKWVVLWESQV